MTLLIDGPKGLWTASARDFRSAMAVYVGTPGWHSVYPTAYLTLRGSALCYETPDGKSRCMVHIAFTQRPL